MFAMHSALGKIDTDSSMINLTNIKKYYSKIYGKFQDEWVKLMDEIRNVHKVNYEYYMDMVYDLAHIENRQHDCNINLTNCEQLMRELRSLFPELKNFDAIKFYKENV